MWEGTLDELTEIYIDFYPNNEEFYESKSKQYYAHLEFVTRKINNLCKKTTRKKLTKVIFSVSKLSKTFQKNKLSLQIIFISFFDIIFFFSQQ
jgi:hypothetical protein